MPNHRGPSVSEAMKSDFVDCPICGIDDQSPYATCDGYQIVRCDNCSLLFVNPRRRPEAVADYFREEYIADEEYAEVQMISYREDSLKREAARIRRHLPQGGRLLDLGAASGAFMREFTGHANWQVEGVEPSKFAVEYARNRLGLTIHQGYLGEQKFPGESFDVVTSLDAFMLHPQPREDMAELGRIVKLGGLLAIEIPGLTFRLIKNSGPLCRVMYGVPVKLNPGDHLYFYSRKTLGMLAAQFGFELVAAYPEQAPVYGSRAGRLAKWAYYQATAGLYHATLGLAHFAPKEFIVFRKTQRAAATLKEAA